MRDYENQTRILVGDVRETLKQLPDESVHCVVTSPPYWGLRDYGTGTWEGGDPACDHKGSDRYYTMRGASSASVEAFSEAGAANAERLKKARWREQGDCACGARRIDRQIGLEPTAEAHIAALLEVFREVRRVLHRSGTLWLNYGDCYACQKNGRAAESIEGDDRRFRDKPFSTVTADVHRKNPVPRMPGPNRSPQIGLKPKDLVMMPFRLAIALQQDGWWVRSAITWCLSGGTRVYARTQKGEMPTTIKDLVRLRPETVQLWNGEKWTQVLGWNETPRPTETYEIELRSGERIGCTAGHLWPTTRGNVRADELKPGDVIQTCRLPQPEEPAMPTAMDDGLTGWFVGLYIAEGSRFDGTISIDGHVKEEERLAKLRAIAAAYHGHCAIHGRTGNGRTIHLSSPMLNGIIDTYVSGAGADGKHLHVRAWQRSDAFLMAVLEGYISGDGHYDAPNQRWRLGYCQNDAWTADLRTICGRLGISLRVRRRLHSLNGRKLPGYRGEIRFGRSGHWNSRQDGEVVAIRKSRARKFWDIGVEDEPHLFALASGVLTHNCKPSAMPESCRDRPTSATEMLFLLAKSERYFYDAAAIAEPCVSEHGSGNGFKRQARLSYQDEDGARGNDEPWLPGGKKNKRNWWVINSEAFAEAHFATMPQALVEPCILAGSSEYGCCPACLAPYDRVVEKRDTGRVQKMGDGWDTGSGSHGTIHRRGRARGQGGQPILASYTDGWRPTCQCDAGDPVPCTVLDPFGGSGTVALVANRLGRRAILCELNAEYVRIAEKRTAQKGLLL